MKDRTYIARCPACEEVIAARVVSDDHANDVARFLASCARRGFPIESVTTGAVRVAHWCKCPRQKRVEVDGLKLWKARVEVEVFMAAENEPSNFDFRNAAKEALSYGGEAGCDVCDIEEAETLSDVPSYWRDAIPEGYENSDDMTCEQIVAATSAARLEAIRNAPLPNQIPLPLEGTP
jgi:hypothetical protein